jgi:hypothetical protein
LLAERNRPEEALSHLDRALELWSAAEPGFHGVAEAETLHQRLGAAF